MAVSAARRLAHVETLTQQDSASNMLNKLARTFAGQVETLKKYRSTGEQNIKVQHVNVADGGQAVIGNVSTGGGAHGKN
jgi:anion-transporting  ArsA/GET3 family ATPase